MNMQPTNTSYTKDDTSYDKQGAVIGFIAALIGLGMRKIYPAQRMGALGKLVSLVAVCGGTSSAFGYGLRETFHPDQGQDQPLDLRKVALYGYGSSLAGVLTTGALLRPLPARAYVVMSAAVSIRPSVDMFLAYQYNQQLKSSKDE